MGLFGRSKPKSDPYAESLARAVPAEATVIGARRVSSASHDVNLSSEVYDVDLDVHRHGDEATRQSVQWTVYNAAIPDIQSGVALSVTVDPERPTIVYPPGYPPAELKPGLISLGDARILPSSAWLDSQLS